MLLEREVESVLVVFLPHSLESKRHTLSVAELTTRADLGAAGERIPSGLGPLNRGLCANDY